MRAWDFPKSLLAWTWRPSRGSSQGRLHQFIHPFIHLFIHSFFHLFTSAGYLLRGSKMGSWQFLSRGYGEP